MPVLALGKSWADALDGAPEVVAERKLFCDFNVASRCALLYTTHDGGSILVVWHSGSDQPPAMDDVLVLRRIWFEGVGRRSNATRSRVTASEPTARRFRDGGNAVAAPDRATSQVMRELFVSLPEWVAEEFAGRAFADHRGASRFRLYVRGERGARVGWDFRPGFLHVWFKRLSEGERQTLSASLSTPDKIKVNAEDVTFQVHNAGDVEQLKSLIRRRVSTI